MTPTSSEPRVQNRAKVLHSVRVVEKTGFVETGSPDFMLPELLNKFEYFDNLYQAVEGLSALLNSELSPDEILTRAAEQTRQIEPESYAVVRELLGEEVTEKMQRISNDLDELAELVASLEASLAAFSPLQESEDGDGPEEFAASQN